MRQVRLISSFLSISLLAASAFAVACADSDDEVTIPSPEATVVSTGGGDPADREAVEQAIRSVVTAYTEQDMEQFLNAWTDEGLRAEFEAGRAEIQELGDEFFSGPPLSLRHFLKTDVKEDKATSDFELVFGSAVTPQRYALIREAGEWKIDGTQDLKAAIPDGVTAVEVDLKEFSFDFDASKFNGGNVAIRVDNVGKQQHELVLLTVPEGFTLQQLLAATDQDIPEGVEALGFGGPYDAGDEGTIVFSERLPAGHYMMVCLLPDETDLQRLPHVLKGMAAEFSIAEAGGN